MLHIYPIYKPNHSRLLFFFGVLIPLKRKYIYFLAKKVITKITYIHCDFMYLKLLNVKL